MFAGILIKDNNKFVYKVIFDCSVWILNIHYTYYTLSDMDYEYIHVLVLYRYNNICNIIIKYSLKCVLLLCMQSRST